MPPVGRPRVTTRQGARPPLNLIGVADPFNYGIGLNPQTGQVAPWHMFIDLQETVPEWFWPNSVWTAEQMRTDSQLAALLTSVMWGISQLRFVIDENGAKPDLVTEISEDLNLPVMGEDHKPQGRLKHRFSHQRFVLQAMLSVIYGHMFFEQNGEVVDGKWRLRKMFPIMPRTISQINVEDDGSLVNVIQWASRNSFLSANPPLSSFAEPIPVERLTGFIFQMEGMNWHGRSMMRDCFKDWVLKDRLMRVEAINHERAGGVPYAVGPQGATLTEIEDLGQMMQQFRIGETAGGAVPYGSSVHIAKGSGSDIDATIKRYDESMARRFMLMLANLAQGGSHVGSYALGETFEDFFLVAQRHIAQWYCDIVNEHVIEDIVDWNYGEDEEFVPKITWERTSEDSLGVEQLSMLVQRGVIIMDEELENAVRYKYQLPSRSTPRPNIIVGPGVPRQPQELAPGQVTPPRGEIPESANPVPAGAGVTQPVKAAGDPSGAPSSGSPAIRASFNWKRFGRKKPDVMAAGSPALVTVANVPVMHAGIEYSLSTGPKTFTPEDLRDAVTAANEDKSIRPARLKIGHVDPRFNDTQVFDGTPNFGVATNLRLSENGMAVYADFVGVPKWLAEIMPTAYPSRSVEGYTNALAYAPDGMQLESQMGKRWRFVISACSLLGVSWPGITVLEDLPQFYGDEVPDGVNIDPALLLAKGGDPVKFRKGKTAASRNLDDVRRAFYDDFVTSRPDANWWWVQAILMDPNELVVEDDETGQLYKIGFASGDDGVVFTDPMPIKLDYIPDTVEAFKAAASHVAATLAIGRDVAASWDTREDSLPQSDTGGSMDPKLIRDRLGLPEEATDEQVQETLRELNAAAGITPEPQIVPPVAEPTPAAEPTGEPTPAAEPVAPAVVAASALPPGVVLVDKAQYDSMIAASNETRDFMAEHRRSKREGLVTAAMQDGRIAPASKDHWLTYLEHDPKGEETLASLQPGLIPVELRATAMGADGEGQDPFNQEQVASWSAQLFPEVRAQQAQDAMVAAGHAMPSRSRISADGHYSRR